MSPGSVVTRAVQKATTSIPVVSVNGDPVGSGFVQSLGRPGSNITGLSLNAGPLIAGKYLELLHEIVPGATRITTVLNTSDPPAVADAQVMHKAAEDLGITLLSHDVRSPSDLPIAFDAIATDGAMP